MMKKLISGVWGVYSQNLHLYGEAKTKILQKIEYYLKVHLVILSHPRQIVKIKIMMAKHMLVKMIN